MDLKKLMQQALKFGVVGAISFAIDFGLYMLLAEIFKLDLLLSAAASFTISVSFNYMASMRYVFTHRADISRKREFVTFVVLSAIGLAINELCVWAGSELLGKSSVAIALTKLFATAIVMVWNFFSRKRWLDGGSDVG